MPMDIAMDITEVSRRSGLPASALRYYEARGLIASSGRRGLRRTFDAGVLERLALIALGQAAGFSLGEIARMIAPDGSPRIDRAWLRAKADALDETIRRIATLRDGLRHAAACSAPSHLECRHFRRLLRLAGSGRLVPPGGGAGRPRRRSAPADDSTVRQSGDGVRGRRSTREEPRGAERGPAIGP